MHKYLIHNKVLKNLYKLELSICLLFTDIEILIMNVSGLVMSQLELETFGIIR